MSIPSRLLSRKSIVEEIPFDPTIPPDAATLERFRKQKWLPPLLEKPKITKRPHAKSRYAIETSTPSDDNEKKRELPKTVTRKDGDRFPSIEIKNAERWKRALVSNDRQRFLLSLAIISIKRRKQEEIIQAKTELAKQSRIDWDLAKSLSKETKFLKYINMLEKRAVKSQSSETSANHELTGSLDLVAVHGGTHSPILSDFSEGQRQYEQESRRRNDSIAEIRRYIDKSFFKPQKRSIEKGNNDFVGFETSRVFGKPEGLSEEKAEEFSRLFKDIVQLGEIALESSQAVETDKRNFNIPKSIAAAIIEIGANGKQSRVGTSKDPNSSAEQTYIVQEDIKDRVRKWRKEFEDTRDTMHYALSQLIIERKSDRLTLADKSADALQLWSTVQEHAEQGGMKKPLQSDQIHMWHRNEAEGTKLPLINRTDPIKNAVPQNISNAAAIALPILVNRNPHGQTTPKATIKKVKSNVEKAMPFTTPIPELPSHDASRVHFST